MNSRSDPQFTAFIDAGAATCRDRSIFWRTLEERGFEVAFRQLVKAGGNADWLEKARERYSEYERERKCR